ncbi:MAG: hypothetical protein FWF33_05175 [Clostridiales bacterium]|nr:hypothetical protein [Clostridiales bacterium]
MYNFIIYREYENGNKESKTISARTLEDAWKDNTGTPVPADRLPAYNDSDRVVGYYYAGQIGEVWTMVFSHELFMRDEKSKHSWVWTLLPKDK